MWFWAPFDKTIGSGSYKYPPIDYDAALINARYDSLHLPNYLRVKAADPDHVAVLNFAPAHGLAFLNGVAPCATCSHPQGSYSTQELVVGSENVVEQYVQDLQRYSQAADIIAVDVYPVGYSDASKTELHRVFEDNSQALVGRYQRLLNEHVVSQQKPVYQILDAYQHYVYSGVGSPAALYYRDVRFQAYDAIINGAAGLFWFGWHALPEYPGSPWPHVKELVHTELSESTFHAVLTAATSPMEDLLSVSAPNEVEYIARTLSGKTYLIAANRSSTALGSVTFANVALPSPTVDVLFQAHSTTALPCGFSDSFDPWEVHVYRLGLPGDFNGDGMVSFEDFFMFSDSFLQQNAAVDMTCDGMVDWADYWVLSDYFGAGSP
jgi:hypothetical protein